MGYQREHNYTEIVQKQGFSTGGEFPPGENFVFARGEFCI